MYDEIVSVEMVKRKEKGTRIVADLVMLCSASGKSWAAATSAATQHRLAQSCLDLCACQLPCRTLAVFPQRASHALASHCCAGGRSRGSRPERYMRLARVRFDSLTPSAGPSVNWRAEAPFYNRCRMFWGAEEYRASLDSFPKFGMWKFVSSAAAQLAN